MKNALTFLTSFACAIFISSQVKAQFDSIPFHNMKQSKDHALMYEADLGAGFMKDEFYHYDFYSQNYFNGQTRYHLFYKVQVGAYYPAVKIGKTGSFGPTLCAGVGFTRREISTASVPLGVMIRFGNDATQKTKKAWGFGMGVAIAPTAYFERQYSYGAVGLKEPMLFAELSTKSVALRLDVLPFPMTKSMPGNSKFTVDSDISLTMSYKFGDLHW